jgi:glyoxylase-like metal-dependent hydrolase (beta-lactamase superfamily II)
VTGVLERLARIGVTVFERGWLSSNNILITGQRGDTALVDTGYAVHAELTVALVDAALQGAPLTRILNTHLHSDHCGGNAALHARWGSAVSVPAPMFQAAGEWNQDLLLFRSTDQHCDRFPVHDALVHGTSVKLGGIEWEVHRAPGHDPDAIMLFQPDARVLISGDALWENRIAVNFPALAGEPGFSQAMEALDTISRLSPDIVIPGHGRPFDDVTAAVKQSRERLDAFAQTPSKHARYAVRALTMFHMLEHRHCNLNQLANWIIHAPIFKSLGLSENPDWGHKIIAGLVADGLLRECDDELSVFDE